MEGKYRILAKRGAFCTPATANARKGLKTMTSRLKNGDASALRPLVEAPDPEAPAAVPSADEAARKIELSAGLVKALWRL